MSTDTLDNPKINLLGLDLKALTQTMVDLGEKPFRAQQILKWIHFHSSDDFNEMTNLSKDLRHKLIEKCEIKAPTVLSEHLAKDGTRKWLFTVQGGSAVETVYIPEPERATLCISSQVGCALNCSFCHTAQQGFQRNLTSAEVIGQLWYVVKTLKKEGVFKAIDRPVTNVVMMGMGEPLLNFDNVVMAINLMLDDLAYGLSKRRVTLSTSGVVPGIDNLAKVTDIALAVSLHAPNDTLRTELVPINKKYPIQVLLEACKRYLKDDKRRRITMEYVMLKGINDKPEHAYELIRVLKDVPSKVNLIPFNPFFGTKYERSDEKTINHFQDILMEAGLVTMKRKTRGDDIDAACGQLAGKVQDRTQRSLKFKQSIELNSKTENIQQM
ncbi:MAG: 23S rRNA (adenine(2503)-C(2))-methyltransferase RlmN [Gammaproteobacteria bacterium]|jgi:23S rRNA (adenine2503-C2)-methyltransferase|nr:23S rRNA (adenine(2503)-C(2))-methyltransferase RlmN [Gammaproteobacteria bacterium]